MNNQITGHHGLMMSYSSWKCWNNGDFAKVRRFAPAPPLDQHRHAKFATFRLMLEEFGRFYVSHLHSIEFADEIIEEMATWINMNQMAAARLLHDWHQSNQTDLDYLIKLNKTEQEFKMTIVQRWIFNQANGIFLLMNEWRTVKFNSSKSIRFT